MKRSPRAPARLLVCAALACSALTSTAQQTTTRQQQPAAQQTTPQHPSQPPTQTPQEIGDEEVIKLSTNIVQLTAVVTDKAGQPVENLSKDDFEVFENGQPRRIDFFSVVRAPESRAPLPANAADANDTSRANVPRPAATTPARTVVIFVDTLHLSPLSLMRAKAQLKRFVDEQLTDADTAAVVAASGSLGILQQFTRDRRILKSAIDRVSLFIGPDTAITPYLASQALADNEQAILEVLKIMYREDGWPPPPLNPETQREAAKGRARELLTEARPLRDATLRVLAGVAGQMASMRGQRMIAFVSDGFSILEDGGIDRAALEEAEGRAARAGVMIYAIYPKGLTGPNDVTSGPRAGEVEGGAFQGESITDAQTNLREMAQETGGGAFFNTNDTLSTLRRMLDENRLYYSLAYYLPKDSDKKFRKINVRVKGHPEYKVRTQRGYAPPSAEEAQVAESPRERLVRQILSPMPATALGVTSSADFLSRAGDEAQVTVRVHIDGDRLQYEPQGENTLARFELAGIVLDRGAKVADNFSESVTATLTPRQLAAARRDGYRYERRLKLPPGLYQVRVGVREPASEKTGTSVSWVEVPDLTKGGLTLSSLFLGEQRDAAVSSAAQAPGSASPVVGAAAQGAQPKLAVGAASIKSGDSIFYRFVAYRPAGAQQSEASMRIEIAQGDAKVYESDWQPLASRTIRRDETGVEVGGRLRLTLPPGIYTLRVTVKDSASKKTVERESDFEIGQ